MHVLAKIRLALLTAVALCAGLANADYFVFWNVADVSEEYAFDKAKVAYKTPGAESYGAFLQTPEEIAGVGFRDLRVAADETRRSTVGESEGRLLALDGTLDYSSTLLQIWLYDDLGAVIGKSAGTMSLADLQAIGAAGETMDPTLHGTWTATTFVAPEPTSGLLVLLGLAGLALKRKRA